MDGGDIDSELVLYHGVGDISFSEWSKRSIDVRRAKEAAKPEEKRRKAIVIEERVKEDVSKGQDEGEAREKWRAALMSDELTSDFVLERHDGALISVREILANPDKFDGERFADPHDRDYRGDKRVAVVYSNSHNTGWPYLFSHSHGGKSYRLDKGPL